MKCSSSVLIWPPRFKRNQNSCAKVFNFDPSPPKTRYSAKEAETGYSHQRWRGQCSHKRQLVLREVFQHEYDVTNLEPSMTIESQHNPKKRKIQGDGRQQKRFKLAEEESSGHAEEIEDDLSENERGVQEIEENFENEMFEEDDS